MIISPSLTEPPVPHFDLRFFGLEEIQLTVLDEVFAGVGLCNKF
jgi:hypothetical protein